MTDKKDRDEQDLPHEKAGSDETESGQTRLALSIKKMRSLRTGASGGGTTVGTWF